MKFVLASIALFAVISGVRCGSIIGTKVTPQDVKLKVCHIIITTQGPILDKYVKAFTQNADDTVAKDVKTLSVLVQNFNKMIGSAYKTVIAPLNNITWSATFDLITMIPTEMTKNLIKAYAVSTQTCQRDIWAFYKLATNQFAGLDGWVHAIANESVNVNKSESCIATASKAIDAMYKAYDIARANCFKVFDASNAEFLSAKGPVAAFINNNAALPATLLLNGIAECFKINQLADAKALAASTNCTKAAFTICVDQFIKNYYSSVADASISKSNVVTIYTANHLVSQTCMQSAYDAVIAAIVTIAYNLKNCILIDQPIIVPIN